MAHGTRVVEPVDNETTVVTTIDSVPFVNEDGILTDRQRVDARALVGATPVSDSNPMPVSITDAVINVDASFSSRVSTLNSSFDALDANETFLGVWEDCLNYAALTFTINTDANSAQDGAVVQWSDNGEDVLSSQFASVQPLPTGVFFALAPQGRYFRVIYTNGPVAQTFLRSEVSMLFTAPALTQGPIANPATDLNIGTTTIAHLKGRIMEGPYTGVWAPIGTDGQGKVLTVDVPAVTELVGLNARADATVAYTGQTVGELQGVNAALDGNLKVTLPDGADPARESTLFGVFTELTSIDAAIHDDGTSGATGVRGWLRRIAEFLNGGIRTRDDISFYATAAGGTTAFNITTGLVTIGASGVQKLGLLVNPADSGVDMFLDLGEFGSSANTTFQRIRNATVSGLVGGIAPNNMGGGSNVSAARFYTGNNFNYTGGVVAKTAHIAAFQQYVTFLKGRVRLRPGQSLLWVIQGPGGLGGSMTASIFFEYWERPAV